MIVYPNAKINLGLFITEKRDDGFHNILSCFYPVDWRDALEIIPAKKTSFSSTGITIPGNPSENLCLKAHHILKTHHQCPDVAIHLHKNIPIGAGLGGGSADASFMLKALNELFELNISTQQLEQYAKTLGSDCAFFIENKSKICYNKGDEFDDCLIDLKQYNILLFYPNIHVGTQEAYRNIAPKTIDKSIIYDLEKSPVHEWKHFLRNDFETSVFSNYPQLNDLKKKFYDAGAIYAAMTGSGSTLYGIFKKNHKPTIDFGMEGLLHWC